MKNSFTRIKAQRKAFDSVKKRQEENPLNNLDSRKNRLKAEREACVGNEEVIEKAVKALQRNGIKVYQVSTAAEAVEKIYNEIEGEKFVVKSKSNVTKEIGLTKEFSKKGVEAVETDIGDRIMQIMDVDPSHPTGPIAHLSAREISEKLTSVLGVEISESPERIVEFIKNDIAEALGTARVGITGANAITAEEGAVVIVHNEGNIYRVMRKEKHIVVTGVDKIYSNLEEALNMVKILTFNATGALVPSFIEIISGVTKTADVEKKFFQGVHNPKEIIVVLVDNKRRMLANSGFTEILYCIGCGNCLLHCPVYNLIGNEFGKGSQLGGKGLVHSSLKNGERDKMLELCLTCGKCKVSCPLNIDIPRYVKDVRSDGSVEEAYYILKSHIFWLYNSLRLNGFRAAEGLFNIKI